LFSFAHLLFGKGFPDALIGNLTVVRVQFKAYVVAFVLIQTASGAFKTVHGVASFQPPQRPRLAQAASFGDFPFSNSGHIPSPWQKSYPHDLCHLHFLS